MKIEKVSIIGVGLIGGSLGLALKKKGLASKIVGIGRRETSLREALRVGAVDEITLDLKEGVSEADLVVLAVPVGSILKIGREIVPHLKQGAILTDVGSTKEEIVRTLGILTKDFVGAHPMAGSNESGVAKATASLFEKATCVITPTGKTSKKALNVVENLWKKVGARVVKMSPETHDFLVAITSHLPHLAASSLVSLAAREKEKIAPLIATGFKDTTRIASSDPRLWSDIFLSNKEMVLSALKEYKEILSEWEELIREEDQEGIRLKFGQAASWWRENVRSYDQTG